MLDEMAVYSALDEQNANGERAKFIAWLAAIGIIGFAVGYGARYAVSAPIEDEETSIYACSKYEIQGSTFAPVCADRRSE